MDNLRTGLYIISTPIGNMGDISFRAEKILKSVDIIICENPKHTLKLLNKLGIKKKLFSLHDYNERALIKKIEKYQLNSSIALVSDAGSPLISDPGYNLTNDYIKKGIYITSIPGSSSLISALQLSGLPSDKFSFLGFIPKNKSAINNLLDSVLKSTFTTIIFVPGKKLEDFLNVFLEKGFSGKIAVCKEITKKNESVFRGLLKDVIFEITKNKLNFKGEFTIVIEGKSKKIDNKIDINIENQIKKLLQKNSLTEVVEIVHKLTNISKKIIYNVALKIKNG